MESNRPQYLKYVGKPRPATPRPWNYDSEDAYFADRWRHKNALALWRHAQKKSHQVKRPSPSNSNTLIDKLPPKIQQILRE